MYLDRQRNGVYNVDMHIATIPNRKSTPCILLRESYRQGKKVCKRTLANITHWPEHVVAGLRVLLEGGEVRTEKVQDDFEIVRTLPYGHVAAVLGTLRQIGLDGLIDSRRGPERDAVEAMIVGRILHPGSKLATARELNAETAATTLGYELGLTEVTDNQLYDAMDWLLARQQRIEDKLAKRHLRDGTLILYDVSASYYTGTHCPLAKHGHPRDGDTGFAQIVYGLLCGPDGCPVAVEVFAGNVADPKTLASQIRKVKERFRLERVVVVGDRGLITASRITDDLEPVPGVDWITALRAPAIRKLAERNLLQMSLFDKRDLAEIRSPDYPDERLIVCRNPLLAEDRARSRNELLAATERDLDKIVAATRRPKRPLRGKDKIALRVGKVINHYKMAKHFALDIRSNRFCYTRRTAEIADEAALDGLYVIRTSVDASAMSADAAVRSYKDLAKVERAFRCLKTVDLKVRPFFHRLEARVRAHVFICMLAYYVEFHMRQRLAPCLFDDEDKEQAEALRDSIVAPAKRSPKATKKERTLRTADDQPVHSFQTILKDLGTIAMNWVRPKLQGAPAFTKTTVPTPSQKRILDLLAVRI
ncbi:MAG: IS1634 family transposase [Gammaproteobacteria bacterium]|nr:IS1634 family transposase [Gammaproteobacteria bacterium]